ncbi:MAG TPA: universal stress protein, partial [Longimicrobiales bacterium]|nr:universal stress protein [Longimicrobiales bacterium]
EATRYLEGVAQRFRDAGVEADVEVVDDPQPALAILEVVERGGADLVALATHGYRGIRRAVLGSVADKVLRGVDVPLLLLGPGVQA